MIICVNKAVPPDVLTTVRRAISKGSFGPGLRTAGWHAAKVKHNDQMMPGAQQKTVEQAVLGALRAHELIGSAALPRRFSAVLVSRYRDGMEYGLHVDNAVMRLGGDDLLRSDLSYTLFLSDPGSYEGGELVIETTAEERVFKLDAGALVLYPSTALHRVRPVTRGERLAAVGWIQSLVRDPGQREILFDLDQARHRLFGSEGKSATFDLVSRSYANLLRRWSEL